LWAYPIDFVFVDHDGGVFYWFAAAWDQEGGFDAMEFGTALT
jgi:hypothetical protein